MIAEKQHKAVQPCLGTLITWALVVRLLGCESTFCPLCDEPPAKIDKRKAHLFYFSALLKMTFFSLQTFGLSWPNIRRSNEKVGSTKVAKLFSRPTLTQSGSTTRCFADRSRYCQKIPEICSTGIWLETLISSFWCNLSQTRVLMAETLFIF